MGDQGFAVLASQDVASDVRTLARVVAKARGTALFEASRFLRDHPGVFARGVGRSVADGLVGALAGAGMPAAVVDEEHMPVKTDAVPVDMGRFDDDAFHYHAVKTPPHHTEAFPLDRAKLVACGWVTDKEVKRERKIERDYVATGRGAVAVNTVRHQNVEKSVWKQLLDVVPADPALPHLRMDAMTFKFASLGTRLFSTRAANFMALAGRFAVQCANAAVDRSITYLLDDDPKTVAKFVSPLAYDNFLLWKTALADRRPRG